MNRRVLHVTPYLDATAGGPPVVVEKLVRHAQENGYSASILTTAAMTTDAGANLSISHTEATVLPTQFSALLGVGSRQFINAITSADILHLHTMWSPIVGLAARQARLRGIPYVLSPHGMLDPYSIGQKRLKKLLYLTAIERRTIRGSARVLFTAEVEKRLAEPVTGDVSSEVISLGADFPPDQPDTLKQEFLSKHPDLRNRKLAIFLGRLHAKKRPQSALRAMRHVLKSQPEACLLFVGSGEAEAELRKLTADFGLQENIRYLGFLSGREKWQTIAAAEVFLLPSQQENFGIALAEALHAGVPALITRKVNIWREISTAGAGRVLNEEDLEESLADGMLQYFHHPEEQKSASDAARSLAARAFDWSVSARLTHALYDEILSS